MILHSSQTEVNLKDLCLGTEDSKFYLGFNKLRLLRILLEMVANESGSIKSRK